MLILLVILDIRFLRYMGPSLEVSLCVPFVTFTLGLHPLVDTFRANFLVIECLRHTYTFVGIVAVHA